MIVSWLCHDYVSWLCQFVTHLAGHRGTLLVRHVHTVLPRHVAALLMRHSCKHQMRSSSKSVIVSVSVCQSACYKCLPWHSVWGTGSQACLVTGRHFCPGIVLHSSLGTLWQCSCPRGQYFAKNSGEKTAFWAKTRFWKMRNLVISFKKIFQSIFFNFLNISEIALMERWGRPHPLTSIISAINVFLSFHKIINPRILSLPWGRGGTAGVPPVWPPYNNN